MNYQVYTAQNFSGTHFIEQWGQSTSIALYDSSSHFFCVPGIEGCIGYRSHSKHLVVFGDPLCSPHDIERITYAFASFSKFLNKSVMYVGASQSFVQHLACADYAWLSIGNELIINPQERPLYKPGKKASYLRNKYNQAMRNNIIIHEYKGGNESVEKSLENLGQMWVRARKGLQIHLYHVEVFSHRNVKRWFYAIHNNEIVGVLILNTLKAVRGWVLNMLMVKPGSPTFTSEFLMISALESLRLEGYEYVSTGVLPGQLLMHMHGFNSFMTWIMPPLFTLSKTCFRLHEKERYWQKFNPQRKPLFLAINKKYIGLRALCDLMRALHVW